MVRAVDISIRILSKFVVTPTCWIWHGAKLKGYGQIRGNDGRTKYAHIVMYELWRGPIPEGLVLDHLCRNPACVRPTHLEPVTQKVNLERGEGWAGVNARKTHCPQGHVYAARTCAGRADYRYCPTCNNARRRKGRE